ncbi:UNVERIFIED_CONTAM: hypothetical protein KB574_09350 [Streptococcus canis]
MIDKIIQYCQAYQLRGYEPVVILLWLWLSLLSLKKVRANKDSYLSGLIAPKYIEMQGFDLPKEDIYEAEYRYRVRLAVVMIVLSVIMLGLYIGLIGIKIIV